MESKERYQFQWSYRFFGLPRNYRKIFHEDVFTLIYHGQGFTHYDVYNMPVYLRRFYIETLIKQKKEEENEIKKAQNNQNQVKDPRQRF
jgi:hypothetical protein